MASFTSRGNDISSDSLVRSGYHIQAGRSQSLAPPRRNPDFARPFCELFLISSIRLFRCLDVRVREHVVLLPF